jgi:hypothetical protein
VPRTLAGSWRLIPGTLVADWRGWHVSDAAHPGTRGRGEGAERGPHAPRRATHASVPISGR